MTTNTHKNLAFTFWCFVFLAAFIFVLRMCAWADTGARGEAPAETSILPASWTK